MGSYQRQHSRSTVGIEPHIRQLKTYKKEPFPKRKILDSSKLKEFADDNFKVDENGRYFFKRIENTGKRRNCSLRAIPPFPTVFSIDFYCRHVKTRACLEKG